MHEDGPHDEGKKVAEETGGGEAGGLWAFGDPRSWSTSDILGLAGRVISGQVGVWGTVMLITVALGLVPVLGAYASQILLALLGITLTLGALQGTPHEGLGQVLGACRERALHLILSMLLWTITMFLLVVGFMMLGGVASVALGGLGAGVVGLVAVIVWVLAVFRVGFYLSHAVMIEGLGPADAMRRSWDLTGRYKSDLLGGLPILVIFGTGLAGKLAAIVVQPLTAPVMASAGPLLGVSAIGVLQSFLLAPVTAYGAVLWTLLYVRVVEIDRGVTGAP